MSRPAGRSGGLILLAAAFVLQPAVAGERSAPVDCFPDRVVTWDAADPDPELRFGASFLPGIVLGPPGNSLIIQGSTSVASLGNGGTTTVAFEDILIEDGPGPDFIVFENAFFVGAPPPTATDSFVVFAELATVEVSADGLAWFSFPFDADAVADATGTTVDAALYARLGGLAGRTPTLTGNWTIPDDPTIWDPAGLGGVSGAGGDAFDLADVGIAVARFVRISDAGTINGAPGAAEGFDLDSVVVLHGRPVPPLTMDQDGDGLSDSTENSIYGSDPADPDSDGDGLDDGREVAACRDPNSASESPAPYLEPTLWVMDGACTELRWTFLGTGITYDLIRGDLAGLTESASEVDLGATSCVTGDHPTMAWSCDATAPASSTGFLYLVEPRGTGLLGRSSLLHPRVDPMGCP
jgi:Bacterial TSP3 repeat